MLRLCPRFLYENKSQVLKPVKYNETRFFNSDRILNYYNLGSMIKKSK
jgi:hypothetical protein